ncbi:Chemotaxis protein CheW [compost metagenome]
MREVLRLDSDAVSATPELVANGIDAAFFKGVGQLGDRLIILLDLQRLLSMEEIAALDKAPV